MSNAEVAATSTADREIVIERVLKAPRERVFRAWTDPEQIAQWWGPEGFTNTIHEMEVRPGGEWRFDMRGPDGVNYPNKIVYLNVAEPERLDYAHGDEAGEQFRVSVTFAAEAGQTRLTLRMVFPTAEACAQTREFGAVEAGHSTLACLEEHLASLAPSGPEFVISRVFDAPRDVVWEVHAQAEHLQRWWGPKGLTLRIAKHEFQPDGTLRYGMEMPDGQVMWGKFIYREVEAPERFSYLVSFTDAEGNPVRHPLCPDWPLEVWDVQTFTEQDGKTTITIRSMPYAATEEACRVFEAGFDSMRQGSGGTWDQLADYLAQLQSQSAS